MFCQVCGDSVLPNSKFCIGCGVQLLGSDQGVLLN